MALQVLNWEMTVTLVDTGANTSTLRFILRAANHGAATAAATLITAQLALLSDCVIQRMALSEVYYNDAFAYPASAETANKASLTVMLTGGDGKKANLKIPGPKDSIFVSSTGSGYNVIDTSNSAVTGYVDLFKSGGSAYISDGEDALDIVSGKRIHAKQFDG